MALKVYHRLEEAISEKQKGKLDVELGKMEYNGTFISINP
jgi:hypothetical protein